MEKSNFLKAKEINEKLEVLNDISLPERVSEVNLVRDDGFVNKWDGSIKASPMCTFKILGEQDDYNRYYISIGDVYLTAFESERLISVVRSIIDERKQKLNSEFDEL